MCDVLPRVGRTFGAGVSTFCRCVDSRADRNRCRELDYDAPRAMCRVVAKYPTRDALATMTDSPLGPWACGLCLRCSSTTPATVDSSIARSVGYWSGLLLAVACARANAQPYAALATRRDLAVTLLVTL